VRWGAVFSSVGRSAAPLDDPQLYRFECPVCEFDSLEAGGQLVRAGTYFCPVCAADSGRDVELRLTPAKRP
jgi:hypothetical protein